MRVLVTGGSGFIGSHVVDVLAENGASVRVFDLAAPLRPDVEFCKGDIRDLDSVRAAMRNIDAVIHLAAIADVNDVIADPRLAEDVIVRGTLNVLEALRTGLSQATIRLIYISTSWVYQGAPGSVVDEETTLGPVLHPYTAFKLAGEHYSWCYSKSFDLQVTILRYGIPYGPRARAAAVVPVFVGKALRGEPLTIHGDGSQFRKFVFVKDLALGTVLALKKVAANRIYNLDGREKVTIRQIAEMLRDLIGSVEIKFVESRTADFAGKEVCSDRAKKELGWEAKTDFRTGLAEYIQWVHEQGVDDGRVIDSRLRALLGE